MDCEPLEKANFASCMNRRVPGSDNTIMLNQKGFWRNVIVGHPVDGLSTPETERIVLWFLRNVSLPRLSRISPVERSLSCHYLHCPSLELHYDTQCHHIE